MHIQTQGLVLRETNYKESDKILTVLTADGGKRTVKAQGCRRKNSRVAASAQLLVYSDMSLFEYRDYFTLREASSLAQFWNVKSDIERLSLGAYFAEAVEAVAEEGRPDQALLSLILNALHVLDKGERPPKLVKAAFELRLMCLAGYEPTLDACANCGEPSPSDGRIHLSEGVLHCAHCRGEIGAGISLPVAPATLQAMRHIAYGEPKKLFAFTLGEGALAQLCDLCEAFSAAQLERSFRTLDFYKGLL